MDNGNPIHLWYTAGLIGAVTVLWFLLLHRQREQAGVNLSE